jgi:hypothetical protein
VTIPKTRTQLGRMSRNKGAKAERDLVAYLRQVGFGGAERAVRTGYRTSERVSADPGDITGTPGIVWSVKDAAVERIDAWLAELDAMDGDDLDLRLLVHKRSGKTDPARWWCWTHLGPLTNLNSRGPALVSFPVRFELGHVIPLLRHAGYGDPIEVIT